MKNKIYLLTFFLLSNVVVFAQKDSVKALNEVNVKGYIEQKSEVLRLSDTHETYIIAGRKNEVLNISQINANLAEKTGRQLFAKIPGVFVYDMDGSGNQVNISTRGLDPHRSWEFNVRQNGVMINSDIYGYPASHYSPPIESVQKVELVRGTAGLQYGAQFGGMINYVTKMPDSSKAISYEGNQTAGSYGLMSSYNALSGKKGKFSYYAYYYKRVSDGYRKNARSDAEAQFVALRYQFLTNLVLKAELGRSTYLFQIPGALTDAMFLKDPRQATRSRNYFNPDIYVPSITLDWQINETTKLNFISSAVLGSRNSVQFLAFADVPDAIDPATNQYKNRQVDIDNFNSYTSELRLVKDFKLGIMPNTFTSGIRYINNDLHRRQLGKGTTGSDFDLAITGDFGRDLHFKTQNIAFFAENLFRLSQKLSFSAGVRIEKGTTDMSGKISYLEAAKIPTSIKHSFPLFGLNAQYKFNQQNNFYVGFSQAYRPVIFADIIPASALERADANIKDSYGINAEMGIRGKHKNWLAYDLSAFLLNYNNRIGSIAMSEGTQVYILRTNMGNSQTKGIELFSEVTLLNNAQAKLSIFTATSYFDAKYTKGTVVLNNENKNIKGNRLETVPKWISRNGLNFAYKRFNATLQYSYVAASYSDALNTQTPSANGAKGLVPAYTLIDFNGTLRIAKQLSLKLGINNLTNEQYFTKRPTGYPGVGVWSSDGRSVVASVVIKY